MSGASGKWVTTICTTRKAHDFVKHETSNFHREAAVAHAARVATSTATPPMVVSFASVDAKQTEALIACFKVVLRARKGRGRVGDLSAADEILCAGLVEAQKHVCDVLATCMPTHIALPCSCNGPQLKLLPLSRIWAALSFLSQPSAK